MHTSDWIDRAVGSVARWEASFPAFEPHPSLEVSDDRFAAVFDAFAERMRGNYPYFHPSYAGQMLKPPHPAAVAAYVAAMLVNPNNHALDGGKVTSELEKEAVAKLAAMFGFDTHLGHLTSSGTIANLEALFVARELHPGRGVAFSADAHYTHARMCAVLGVEGTAVDADSAGRMDLDALSDLLAGGRVGTVVATVGTTGLGAIDQVHEVLAVARRHGVRVHVDAAYGGFYTLLASHQGADQQGADQQGADHQGDAGLDPRPWRAISECDSVVVDPHKHGLQPYGCGAVLFADPAVGRFYAHDSPYTYFTSDELHLGEISLECSRAGAAAAALWLTLELFPLTADGLGRELAACRRASLRFAEMIGESDRFRLYQRPELDIVSYFPVTDTVSLAAIDEASGQVLAAGMNDPDHPVFVSTLTVTAEAFGRRHADLGVGLAADLAAGRSQARILRSVLMKPESEFYAAELCARLGRLAD